MFDFIMLITTIAFWIGVVYLYFLFQQFYRPFLNRCKKKYKLKILLMITKLSVKKFFLP